jgi:PGF-pre-PGF domain-containing protein
MMNRTKSGFLICVLILSISICNVNADAVTLVYPSNISVGQMFDVNVIIDTDGTAITGAQLDLEFNKSNILINSITEGDLFKKGGTSTIFNSGTISNSIGKAEKIYGAILGLKNVTTSGTFIIINATAIGSTNAADINIMNVLVVDPQGKQIYPIPTPKPISETEGASMAPGGGGSGGASGENYANIEFTEKYDKYIYTDITTSYLFEKTNNPIIYVNITGNTNSVETTTMVEGLYGTSSLAKIPSPESVYKNVNIWVGTFGYATPKNIKNAEIIFKVPLAWMEDYNIDPESILMMRYDIDWQALPTKKIAIFNGEIIYEAKTIGFSPFAITGKKADSQLIYDNYRNNEGQIIIESQEKELDNKGLAPGETVPEPESSNKILFIAAFFGIIIISILVYKYVIPKYSASKGVVHDIENKNNVVSDILKQKKIVKTTRKKLSSIIQSEASDGSIKNIAAETKISESSIKKVRSPRSKDHEPIQTKKTSRKKKETVKSTGKPAA